MNLMKVARLTDKNIMVSILIFTSISSLLTFLFPIGWFFNGDYYIGLGLIIGTSYHLLMVVKSDENVSFVILSVELLFIAIVGGLLSGTIIVIAFYLLGRAAGVIVSFVDFLLVYIQSVLT
ncbi:MAG: hypothetical protein ACTSPV_13840, partial [Candidatus Hodarchaeales archaeon]